jgi:hypothetical protein
MLLVGEVRTSLLTHSAPMPTDAGERLLSLLAGAPVRRSERPIARVVSPARFTGVDCSLAAGSGRTVRSVGTVSSRAVLTGGRVLQGSAAAEIARSAQNRRLPWSHYLARPGRVEAIGRYREPEVAAAFLESPGPQSSGADDWLDLGAIAQHTVNTVYDDAALDFRPPLKSGETRLRWAATWAVTRTDGAPEVAAGDVVEFVLRPTDVRTARIETTTADPAAVVALCEDLALHDWLLTTLTAVIDRSLRGDRAGTRALRQLRPAVDCLLHLWMPGAHVGDELIAVWDGLERRPGFSRQWQTAVQRIRDFLAVSTLQELDRAGRASGAGPT